MGFLEKNLICYYKILICGFQVDSLLFNFNDCSVAGQPLLTPGGNIFLLELWPWACVEEHMSAWLMGRKRFPDL